MEGVSENTVEGPDRVVDPAGSEERAVRLRGLGYRTLAKVLREDNPDEFQILVRRRAGNRGIWLRGLVQ